VEAAVGAVASKDLERKLTEEALRVMRESQVKISSK
jgi:hypothetical protein